MRVARITQTSVIDQILTHRRTRAARMAHRQPRSPSSTRAPPAPDTGHAPHARPPTPRPPPRARPRHPLPYAPRGLRRGRQSHRRVRSSPPVSPLPEPLPSRPTRREQEGARRRPAVGARGGRRGRCSTDSRPPRLNFIRHPDIGDHLVILTHPDRAAHAAPHAAWLPLSRGPPRPRVPTRPTPVRWTPRLSPSPAQRPCHHAGTDGVAVVPPQRVTVRRHPPYRDRRSHGLRGRGIQPAEGAIARQTVLAPSVIASYSRPAPIEIPIPLQSPGKLRVRHRASAPARPGRRCRIWVRPREGAARLQEPAIYRTSTREVLR